MAQIGALNNNGSFSVDGGSMVSITGNVLNNGSLSVGPGRGGGDVFNVGGTLTNNNFFGVDNIDEVANVNTLLNNGAVFVASGATLNVAPGNLVTDIVSGTSYQIYGTFNAGAASALITLNSIEGQLVLGNGRRQT